MDKIEEALTEYFGERCPDYHKECACCQAWEQYDTLKAVKEEVRDYYMPKIKNIFTRLHGGTDDMRDEGHKLWLVYKDLHQLTKESTHELHTPLPPLR